MVTPNWYSYGSPNTGLTPTGTGTIRTTLDGKFQAASKWVRWGSKETFTAPYTWTGKFKVHRRLANPLVINGITQTYNHSLVFHPATMPHGQGGSNNNNIVLGLWAEGADHVGVSAEVWQPELGRSKYGVRTGYVSRYQPKTIPRLTSAWHDFRIDVTDGGGSYRLTLDGVVLADVVEKAPYSMSGALSVGLRLDGFDVEFADMQVIDSTPTKESLTPMTYRIVPRTEFGLPAVVTSSDGSVRPPLEYEPYMTAHYTGTNVDYTLKVTPDVVRQIQAVFGATKPFEYNYVIGQEDDDLIYEFAGLFQAAHSAGENADAFGVLFLLGVGEEPTERMINKWRWLRDVLIYTGRLRPDVDQRMHKDMPDAATACPGGIVPWWSRFLLPTTQAAPLVPTPPTPPTPPITQPATKEIDMIVLDHGTVNTTSWTALVWTGVELSHLKNGNAAAVLVRAGVARQPVSTAELDAVIAGSTTKSDCPVTFTGARKIAWDTRRG